MLGNWFMQTWYDISPVFKESGFMKLGSRFFQIEKF